MALDFGLKRTIVEVPSGNNKVIVGIVPDTDTGKNYIDVRNFYQKDGEWFPKKQGILLPLDILPQVLDGMKNAHAVATV